MVNLLSKRVPKRTGELASELPTASEDAVKKNEQCDGEKTATGEATPSVATAVSVVPVRTEVRAMEAIRVPERPEDKARTSETATRMSTVGTTIRVSMVFSRLKLR
jgi:hypothetical protein